MKLTKFLKAHPSVLKDVAVCTCLVGASAGIVFGVSAGMFKIEYMQLDNPELRLAASSAAAYYGEAIQSAWNMNKTDTMDAVEQPLNNHLSSFDGQNWWKSVHKHAQSFPWEKAEPGKPSAREGANISPDAINARHQLVAMVIDGATQTTMDRSFNQSLYEGLVDYIKNQKLSSYDAENLPDPVGKNTALSYRPAQDNPTEFENIYLSAIQHHIVLGLAGFNHSTPLNNLMSHAEIGGGKLDPLVSTGNDNVDKQVDETSFILVDSNVPNNQNIASVQFRADEPGFLAALSTCSYFYNNLDIYHDHFQDLSVAAFGGVKIPTVLIYMGGFQRGLELFNYQVLTNILKLGSQYYYDGVVPPAVDAHFKDDFINLLEHSKYKEELLEIKTSEEFTKKMFDKLYDEYSVKMIKLGVVDEHFSGTFSSGDAIGITKQYLNRGAGAIIAVAGPQSLDAAQEIKSQNSKCIVVGVDTAMENSDYQRFHNGCDESSRQEHNTNDPFMDQSKAPDGSTPENANGIIKFSALKDIKKVTNRITRLSLEGEAYDRPVQIEGLMYRPDPLKSICGPGYQTCGNIMNGLISVSWDGFYPLIQALQCVDFYDNGSGEILRLSQIWPDAVNKYINSLPSADQPEIKYTEIISDLSNCATFDRTSENGQVLYRNFSHTMCILGTALSDSQYNVKFDRTMTLEPNDGGGFHILDEGQILDMPILSWLETNMYVTC